MSLRIFMIGISLLALGSHTSMAQSPPQGIVVEVATWGSATDRRNVTDKIRTLCAGVQTCQVTPNVGLLGPFPGDPKPYLTVQWSCASTKKPDIKMAFNIAATMTCS